MIHHNSEISWDTEIIWVRYEIHRDIRRYTDMIRHRYRDIIKQKHPETHRYHRIQIHYDIEASWHIQGQYERQRHHEKHIHGIKPQWHHETETLRDSQEHHETQHRPQTSSVLKSSSSTSTSPLCVFFLTCLAISLSLMASFSDFSIISSSCDQTSNPHFRWTIVMGDHTSNNSFKTWLTQCYCSFSSS